MEALTAAAVAALTVYDMTKALDKAIVIRDSVGSKDGRQERRLFAGICLRGRGVHRPG